MIWAQAPAFNIKHLKYYYWGWFFIENCSFAIEWDVRNVYCLTSYEFCGKKTFHFFICRTEKLYETDSATSRLKV